MMRMLRTAVVLPSLLALFVNCTALKVRPENDADPPQGLRYSLPKPCLLVKPAPEGEGKFTVEVVYLPDKAHTYAIDAQSYLAAHKLDIKLKDGLLEKVVWNPNSADVAEKAIGAAATVANEKLKADLDAKKAAREAEQKRQDEFVKKVTELNTTVEQKSLEVRKLEAKLTALRAQNPPDQKAIGETEVLLAQAKVELTAAQQAQASFTGGMPGLALNLSPLFNDPTVKKVAREAGDKTVVKKAWSPVLYAINEGMKDGRPEVSLKAATYVDASGAERPQILITTSAIRPEPKFPEAPQFSGDGTVTLEKGTREYVFHLTHPVVAVSNVLLFRLPSKELVKDGARVEITDPAKPTLKATFEPQLPVGDYNLDVTATYQKDGKSRTAVLTASIRVVAK